MPRKYIRLNPGYRLLSKVRSTDLIGDGCWRFDGYCNPQGYGSLSMPGTRPSMAHRVAYEIWIGPILDGLQIDHLCWNKACIRPSHLEAVTHFENNRRAALRRSGGKCKRGHVRPINTRCRECDRIWYAAKREAGYVAGKTPENLYPGEHKGAA